MCAATVLFFSDMDTRMKAEPKSAAEFYAVYKRYNLWLPPKNAKLIRWVDTEQKLVNLDILVRVKSNTEPAIIHTRYTEYSEYRESRLTVVSPTISAIEGIEYTAENWLALAAWSHHLGWTDLAAEAFLRGKKCTGSGQNPDEVTGNPCHTLSIVRRMAWRQYTYSLVEIDTDRSNAFTYMKLICDDDWHYQVRDSDLLVDLRRTLHKTKADLEGIEGNITKLCDEDSNLLWHADLAATPTAYDKICHLGFDAVPFLIAHLNDTRLTRSTVTNSFGDGVLIETVGGICGQILSEISNSEYLPESEAKLLERQRLATLWLEKAKKIGEEKWASTYAVHMRTNNPTLLRLLAAKYPKRLIVIYRNSLKNKPELRCQISIALVHANLSVATKIDWLLEGAYHPQKIHRLNAITCLEVLDKTNFTRALTRHFIHLVDECQTNEELELSNVEADSVMKSDDSKCWDAFIRRLKTASPSSRVSALRSLAVYRPFELARYVQHFRALEHFWHDQSSAAKNFAVCDSVTMLFAEILGIDVPSKTDRSPEEWTTIRHRVRTAWSAYKNCIAGG